MNLGWESKVAAMLVLKQQNVCLQQIVHHQEILNLKFLSFITAKKVKQSKILYISYSVVCIQSVCMHR